MSLAFLRIPAAGRKAADALKRCCLKYFLRLLPDGLDKVSRKSKNK
jgi:hypothetical protein